MSKKIKLSSLIPDDKNNNKHTAYGMDLLEKSVNKVGIIESITVSNDDKIISGNARHEVIGKNFEKEALVIETDGTQPIVIKRTDIESNTKEFYEASILANTTSKKNIDFDMEVIDSLAVEYDIDVVDLGVDIVNEEILEAEEDDFNGVAPKEPITVLGDLYEIGEHRLLCGDSTCSDTVGKLMNGETAELLFTSPPYSDMRTYNGDKDVSVTNLIEFIPTFLQYAEYQVINLGLQRKDNEVVEYWQDYIDKAKECGYKFLSWNVWDKMNGGSIASATAMFMLVHEWIFVFGKKHKDLNRTIENKVKPKSKREETHVRQADGTHQKTTTLRYDNHQIHSVTQCLYEIGSIRSLHPATFPIGLPSEYIKAMTNEGDYICEPFTGSGTTMVASHQLKRKCYGMELDPKYCDVIVARMIKLDSTLPIKRNGVLLTNSEVLKFTENTSESN